MCKTVAMGWNKSELLTVPFLEVTENPYTKTHCRTQIPSKRLTENVKCRKCFGSVIKFFFFISFEFVSIVFVMVGVKGYLDKQAQLIDWLTKELTDWLIADWLTDWQTDQLTYRLTVWLTNWPTDLWTDCLTNRHWDKLSDLYNRPTDWLNYSLGGCLNFSQQTDWIP